MLFGDVAWILFQLVIALMNRPKALEIVGTAQMRKKLETEVILIQ